MICLRDDCLLVRSSDGVTIPLAAHQVTIELLGDATQFLEPELVKHAAAGVLEYFKTELGRETVTVAEFTETLARVLRKFGVSVECSGADPEPADPPAVHPSVCDHDLPSMATECGKSYELGFFQALRDTLRKALATAPQAVRYHGLRRCIKQLSGRRRWCRACRDLEVQVVNYLRDTFRQSAGGRAVSLVVR